jgi:hypothetical protein
VERDRRGRMEVSCMVVFWISRGQRLPLTVWFVVEREVRE